MRHWPPPRCRPTAISTGANSPSNAQANQQEATPSRKQRPSEPAGSNVSAGPIYSGPCPAAQPPIFHFTTAGARPRPRVVCCGTDVALPIYHHVANHYRRTVQNPAAAAPHTLFFFIPNQYRLCLVPMECKIQIANYFEMMKCKIPKFL
jgi:hypothetical protein